jgi:ABC-type bacteriocin/lantibiotic exporter with double-glycine peptidase domain
MIMSQILKKFFLIFNFLNKDIKKKIPILFFITLFSGLIEIVNLYFIGFYVNLVTQFEKFYLKTNLKNFFFFEFEYYLDEKFFLVISLIVLVIFILTVIFTYVTSVFIIWIGNKSIFNLADKIYLKYLYNNTQFNKKITFSEIQNQIFSESNRAGTMLISSLQILARSLLTFIILLYLLTLQPKITAIIFTIFFVIYILFYKKIKTVLLAQSEKISKYNTSRFEIFNISFKGIKEIKIYRLENYLKQNFLKASKILRQIRVFFKAIDLLPKVILDISLFSSFICITLYIIFYKNTGIYEYLSLAAVYLFAALRLLPSFQIIYTNLNSLNIDQSSIKNLETIFKSKKIDLHNQNVKKIIFRNILCKNLGIKYTKNVLIQNLNYNFKKNNKYLIFGKSGIGKSSFFDLILGLKENEQGLIFLNGKKIDQTSLIQLRGISSLIQQKTFIFNGSVLENITFEKNIDKIDLKFLNEILNDLDLNFGKKTLKSILHKKIGDDFTQISGGEKQKIGIARALYKKPQILFMDEATNSLDPKNEIKIVKKIININNLTLLFISHNKNLKKYFKNKLDFEKYV